MQNDRFWNLLAKKLSGEASEDEVAELAALIKAYPELSYPAQNIADLWKLESQKNTQQSEAAFLELFSRLNPPSPIVDSEGLTPANELLDKQSNKKRTVQLLFAGVIVLAGFLLHFIINNPSTVVPRAAQLQEILTRPGSQTRVVLPDSTVVWLNAGSKLTYTLPFGPEQRTVTLTGEGYFDVKKSQVPFLVYTNGVQIKVLGTAFNLRSYPAEKKIETSLVHGRVEIWFDKSPEDKFYLKPKQKLTLDLSPRIDKKVRQKEVIPTAVFSGLGYLNDNTIAETSWVENKLVFDDESFEEVMQKMERWYGVSIDIQYEKLKRERYTGVFEKENLWQALEAMKLTTPFEYSAKNKKIQITQ